MMGELTIKDIAKACGVGVSTVSRAINNHPDINPETRKKIMDIIAEKGFTPNNSARNLKRTETNSISLLVKGISNPFFADMIRIMEDYVLRKRYTTLLRHVGNDDDEVAVAQTIVTEQKVKGIVFLGGTFTHDQAALDQLNAKYVFSTIGNLNESATEDKKVANIAVDDIQASCKAVEYLIEQGHRNIALIAEGLNRPSIGQLRGQGYKKALLEHGIPIRPELIYEIKTTDDPYSMENGYKAAFKLLTAHPKITAIFSISDVLAFGACRAIFDLGKKIPEDVSVVGYDGIEQGDYYNPRLTTVRQPVEEMARVTIEHLFEMIEENVDPKDIIMPAELQVKASSGKAKV